MHREMEDGREVGYSLLSIRSISNLLDLHVSLSVCSWFCTAGFKMVGTAKIGQETDYVCPEHLGLIAGEAA